jgi:hypothetical protein
LRHLLKLHQYKYLYGVQVQVVAVKVVVEVDLLQQLLTVLPTLLSKLLLEGVDKKVVRKMVVAADILVYLLTLGEEIVRSPIIMPLLFLLALVVVDLTLMVLAVVEAATLGRVVLLAAVKAVAVVKIKPTIMVDRVAVTAQHLKVIAMADR